MIHFTDRYCVVVQEQEAMITQLNARLKYVEQSLEDANKCKSL